MRKISHKTSKMKRIEHEMGVEIEETLRRMFVDENMSIQDIAEHLHISYPIVIDWLRLCGVYSRKLHL